jgi:hypothetical protein
MTDAGADATCPYCGETSWVPIDTGGAARQFLVYDCEVCCRPMYLTASRTPEGTVELHAVTEDDAPAGSW